ncbi:hypothetical protein KM043_007091 [Ampulex compressa]|nr:hypothetical protein KM043_007091 [Ampulex compressa]
MGTQIVRWQGLKLYRLGYGKGHERRKEGDVGVPKPVYWKDLEEGAGLKTLTKLLNTPALSPFYIRQMKPGRVEKEKAGRWLKGKKGRDWWMQRRSRVCREEQGAGRDTDTRR